MLRLSIKERGREDPPTDSLAPSGVLMTGMKELLDDPVHSDLTIICSGKQFKVHKVILHTQSTYFKKLLHSDFEAKFFGRLKLDDDPEVLEALVKYPYTREYDDGSRGEQEVAPFSTRLYRITEKYESLPLSQLAAKRLQDTINPRDICAFLETLELIESSPAKSSLRDSIVPFTKHHMAFLFGFQRLRDGQRRIDDPLSRLLATLDPKGSAARARMARAASNMVPV